MSKTQQAAQQQDYPASNATHLELVADIIADDCNFLHPTFTAGRLRALAQQLRDGAAKAQAANPPTQHHTAFQTGAQDEALERARRELEEARATLEQREREHRERVQQMARVIGDMAADVERAEARSQQSTLTVVFSTSEGIDPDLAGDILLFLAEQSEISK